MFKFLPRRFVVSLLGLLMAATTIAFSQAAPPSAPAGVTHGAIQTMPGWESCDVCAGIGAKGPRAASAMTGNQQSPSLSRQAARFDISGATPYADAIWWKQLGGDDGKTRFQ